MFGEVVRAHRRRLGLTQEDLAEKTGVSVRSIGKIEAGRIAAPRPATVCLLADAFELTGADRDRFCAAAAPETPAEERALSTGNTVPAQLPLDVRGFAGRRGELDRLDAIGAAAERHSAAVVITALSGTAGVGKTTLAVHWAHRVRDRYPDGQLYVNLRGFDPTGTTVSPTDAVRRFLDALNVPADRIPADLDARAALYRSLLAERCMLVVLDNARNAEQIRPLLPGSPDCLVLVTSRDHLTSLVASAGAHSVILDLLTKEEAREMLAHRLGSDRTGAEPTAIDDIITACARLPLALAIVAARAVTQPRTAFKALAGELRDARTRLDALTDTDPVTDVRAVFSWSYCALSAPAARLFRLLALHSGPDISATAAASLAGLSPRQATALLAELAGACLVIEARPGRYAFHDLLRDYATEQCHASSPQADRDQAMHRLLDHYLHTAYHADRLLHPARDPIDLAPAQPAVIPERFDDRERALHWLAIERPVLVATATRTTAGWYNHIWQLGRTLTPFLDWQGHHHDLAAVQEAAVAAAHRSADVRTQASMHRLLSIAYRQLGRFDDARDQLQLALDLSIEAGDETGQADTHHNLSWLWERQGGHDKAVDHSRQALALFKAAGNRDGQARALNGIGWNYARLGEYQRALSYCEHALAAYQEFDATEGEAHTWDSLGYIHQHLNDHERAIACYRNALDLHRELGNRYHEADTLTKLAETQHTAGDPDAARDTYRRALTILDEIDHPDADTVREKLAAAPSRIAPR